MNNMQPGVALKSTKWQPFMHHYQLFSFNIQMFAPSLDRPIK